jgi:2'-5' RNA ligase
MAEPNRLFFALWPGDPVRRKAALAAEALRARHALGGYLSKPERYHITLFFLGDEVPKEVEVAAIKAARHIEAPPFTLRLDQAGGFRNPQIPIWLGAGNPPPELEYLEQALRKALAGLPLGRQPRFKPHLTVLRSAEKLLRTEAIEPIEWRVDGFVLIRSVTGKGPVRYTELAHYPLRGKPLPPQPRQGKLF